LFSGFDRFSRVRHAFSQGVSRVAALLVPTHRPPPAIYRAARALRRLGTVVVVILVLFAATVAYSAVEVAHSSVQSRALTASFAPNATLEISGSFAVSNPGLYPIQGVTLTARITNGAGVLLGTVGVGPKDIDPSATVDFPIAVFFPVTSAGPAGSLLTVDQYLDVTAWGNLTYAFLFPLSVTLNETRAWGAPFEGFHVGVGTPAGGGTTVPVTMTFANHASSYDSGTVTFTLESPSYVDCGSGMFQLDVPPGGFFDQTQNVAIATGCNLTGGSVLSAYSGSGGTTPLPPEAIP